MVTLQERLRLLESATEVVFKEDCFDDEQQHAEIMSPMPGIEEFTLERARNLQKHKNDMVSAEMKAFYQEPLLKPAQEKHLFRQLNFLSYQISLALQKIDQNDLQNELDKIDQAEGLFSQWKQVRDQIVGSNVRLVMSVAKKKLTWINNEIELDKNNILDTLMEYVADGYKALARAVDRFNYLLGIKFSTYLTYACKNSMRESQIRRTKEYQKRAEDGYLILNDIPAPEEEEQPLDIEGIKRIVYRMRDKRKRMIIIETFGLHGKECKTLKEVGKELGVSKERVRQIRLDAFRILREAVVRKKIIPPHTWSKKSNDANRSLVV